MSIEDSTKYLNKDNVKPLHFTLDNLVLVLEQAFKTLKDINQGNLILAVGTTGCGKSTMFTSLMFGSDALEEAKIKYEIDVP
jgi:ABC-type nitrate/sulfonate/bicarbonate transport system ATPase subunit